MESISGPDGLFRLSLTHRSFPISWMGRFPPINSSIILIISVLLTETWPPFITENVQLADKFLYRIVTHQFEYKTVIIGSISSTLVSLFIYASIPQVIFRLLYFRKFDFSNSSFDSFWTSKEEGRERK